ncbi:hypothetical protein J6590_058430 [Homalodisca vitripennis]|nr:hypothetical protein J6590_058430 [Homalodisca vitripennis]
MSTLPGVSSGRFVRESHQLTGQFLPLGDRDHPALVPAHQEQFLPLGDQNHLALVPAHWGQFPATRGPGSPRPNVSSSLGTVPCHSGTGITSP